MLPRYGPDATVVRRTLLSVAKSRGPDLALAASVRELFARRFVDARMNLVFLKQFRQAVAGDRASYQAIVEADATVTAMRSWRPLLSPYEVTVCDFDSHPLATELGLGRGPLASTFGGSADMDFVMNAGREVYGARRRCRPPRSSEPTAPDMVYAREIRCVRPLRHSPAATSPTRRSIARSR